MSQALSIPELTWHTASYLTSPDIAHLTQCNRNLRGALLPTLYCHVEVSLYKITSMDWTLLKNPSLAKHTRSLTITMSGQPDDDESIAYHTNYSYLREETRSDIRESLMTVIQEFSKHGELRYFSWDPRHRTPGHTWMLDFQRMWSYLSLSSKSLRELDCSFNLHNRMNGFIIPTVSTTVSNANDTREACV